MASVYRCNWLSTEPSANDNINNDVTIDRRTGTTPDFVWVQVWHGTIVLNAPEVKAALALLGTNVLKRKALQDMVKAKALEMKIDTPDDVVIDITGLITFPDEIVIR